MRYVDNRSLWLDEAFLGLNLISRSTSELVTSLDYAQSAPPGFLLAEKAAIALLGDGEWALRLVPFLSSLAGLLLFALVARRLLRPGGALLAAALFALNEPLLFQSAETKPYSLDVAVALLVLWLSLRALDGPGERPAVRELLALAFVGVGAVSFSYPAVFVLASASGALLLRWRSSSRALATLAALGAVWASSFLVVYTTSSDTIATIRGSLFPSERPADLTDVPRNAWYTLADPGGAVGAAHVLAALLLVFGFAGLALRDRVDRLAVVAGPGLLALLAALTGRYPLGGRFSLFLVPFLVILIVRGLEDVAALVPARAWRAALAAAAAMVLLALPVRDAVVHTYDPPRREHIRPLLQRLVRDWKPGDGVYVYRNAQYAFRYYGECRDCGVPNYPFPLEVPRRYLDNEGVAAALVTSAPAVVIGTPEDVNGGTRNLRLLHGRNRIWALFSHVGVGHRNVGEGDRLLRELGRKGRRLGSWREVGAELYLYGVDGRGRS